MAASRTTTRLVVRCMHQSRQRSRSKSHCDPAVCSSRRADAGEFEQETGRYNNTRTALVTSTAPAEPIIRVKSGPIIPQWQICCTMGLSVTARTRRVKKLKHLSSSAFKDASLRAPWLDFPLAPHTHSQKKPQERR